MKFNKKLQLLRDDMKLSQEELADKLDVSRQSVTKWENGQSFPDIQKLIGLSNLFHISIDRLVKENDECNINLLEKTECQVHGESAIYPFMTSALPFMTPAKPFVYKCRYTKCKYINQNR